MSNKIKILYVDDEPVNLELFEINFSEKYHFITADNGFDGLEKLCADDEIKVVISDMKMPGMNGIEFITKAKAKCADKLFFILTGYDITPEIQHALSSGLIMRYFSKPFNMNEIDEAIHAVLK